MVHTTLGTPLGTPVVYTQHASLGTPRGIHPACLPCTPWVYHPGIYASLYTLGIPTLVYMLLLASQDPSGRHI